MRCTETNKQTDISERVWREKERKVGGERERERERERGTVRL